MVYAMRAAPRYSFIPPRGPQGGCRQRRCAPYDGGAMLKLHFRHAPDESTTDGATAHEPPRAAGAAPQTAGAPDGAASGSDGTAPQAATATAESARPATDEAVQREGIRLEARNLTTTIGH